jgi:hypothetical protein
VNHLKSASPNSCAISPICLRAPSKPVLPNPCADFLEFGTLFSSRVPFLPGCRNADVAENGKAEAVGPTAGTCSLPACFHRP